MLPFGQEAQGNLATNATLQVASQCLNNTTLIGGGAEITTVQGEGSAAIYASYPQAVGVSGTWVATVIRTAGSGTVGIRAWAICIATP